MVDKYALNKTLTKLVRGLAKWRRKTVDFMDDYANDLAEAFSKVTVAEEPQQAAPARTPQANEPIVVQPKQTVTPVAVQQVVPVAQPVFEETDDLPETLRGEGGFGSTGR